MIEILQILSLPILGFCLIAMTVAFAYMTFRDHARERERERKDAEKVRDKAQRKGGRRRT